MVKLSALQKKDNKNEQKMFAVKQLFSIYAFEWLVILK